MTRGIEISMEMGLRTSVPSFSTGLGTGSPSPRRGSSTLSRSTRRKRTDVDALRCRAKIHHAEAPRPWTDPSLPSNLPRSGILELPPVDLPQPLGQHRLDHEAVGRLALVITDPVDNEEVLSSVDAVLWCERPLRPRPQTAGWSSLRSSSRAVAGILSPGADGGPFAVHKGCRPGRGR